VYNIEHRLLVNYLGSGVFEWLAGPALARGLCANQRLEMRYKNAFCSLRTLCPEDDGRVLLEAQGLTEDAQDTGLTKACKDWKGHRKGNALRHFVCLFALEDFDLRPHDQRPSYEVELRSAVRSFEPADYVGFACRVRNEHLLRLLCNHRKYFLDASRDETLTSFTCRNGPPGTGMDPPWALVEERLLYPPAFHTHSKDVFFTSSSRPPRIVDPPKLLPPPLLASKTTPPRSLSFRKCSHLGDTF
jgi:hypothetical protein